MHHASRHAAVIALLALTAACFGYAPPVEPLHPGMRLRVTAPAALAVADAEGTSALTGCRAMRVNGRLTRVAGDTLVLDSSGINGTGDTRDCLMLHRVAIVPSASGALVTARRLDKRRTTAVVAASVAYFGLMVLISDSPGKAHTTK